MEQSGNDLIIQLNKGDTHAFSAIYKEQYPRIYYFVKQFVDKHEDAEDITADIFVKLWKMHDQFTDIKNLQAFLIVTARNTCIDFLRHTKRQQEKQKGLLHSLSQEPAELPLKDDLKAEVLQAIYTEIENLPPACRRVFKMSYFDGLPNDAIARILHINNLSVRNHKQRAIKLLRIALFNKNIIAGAIFYLLRLRIVDIFNYFLP